MTARNAFQSTSQIRERWLNDALFYGISCHLPPSFARASCSFDSYPTASSFSKSQPVSPPCRGSARRCRADGACRNQRRLMRSLSSFQMSLCKPAVTQAVENKGTVGRFGDTSSWELLREVENRTSVTCRAGRDPSVYQPVSPAVSSQPPPPVQNTSP